MMSKMLMPHQKEIIMTLTSKMIKAWGREIGAGDVGIANIDRFKNAPKMMHPKNIFPECKSVISIVQPIPRGTYRGISEGTHWSNYTFYAYNRLNTLFRPAKTYKLACLIENQGYEAAPIYPGVPERPGIQTPVANDGRPAAEVNINVRIAAVACGLGEIGWSKVFIHPKFGPRVRIGTILTDAELEPDPLVKPGTLCNKCMKCVPTCPGNAIPKPKDRPPIKIKIDDTEYEWGDVHMGRCTLTHHGMNYKASPFLKKYFPGFNFNVCDSDLSEEAAYKLGYIMALGNWSPSQEFPTSDAIPYYKQILDHTGYFAICGAKGCIRGCMANMEKHGRIEQDTFPTPVFPEKQWELQPPEDDETGGIAEGKFPELFNEPDLNAGNWQNKH